MNLQKLIALVKECLSIVATATSKDNEIAMLCNSAIADMERLGIEIDLSNPMQKTAIVQYVKGNFGMTDIEQKELCLKSYNLLVSSLQMSKEE